MLLVNEHGLFLWKTKKKEWNGRETKQDRTLVNFTIDQWNYVYKTLIQKFIQKIMEESCCCWKIY